MAAFKVGLSRLFQSRRANKRGPISPPAQSGYRLFPSWLSERLWVTTEDGADVLRRVRLPPIACTRPGEGVGRQAGPLLLLDPQWARVSGQPGRAYFLQGGWLANPALMRRATAPKKNPHVEYVCACVVCVCVCLRATFGENRIGPSTVRGMLAGVLVWVERERKAGRPVGVGAPYPHGDPPPTLRGTTTTTNVLARDVRRVRKGWGYKKLERSPPWRL